MIKKDRTGETSYNDFGSEMVIINYKSSKDVNVYFPAYNWIFYHARYDHFKNKGIKCPYEKRNCGVGYLGEGKYKSKKEGSKTKCYITWNGMLRRCYDSKCREKHPTYKKCTVEKNWHNFQNFGKWFDENYYEIPGERMCLDKDILLKNNKIYNSTTCIFVPHNINSLFLKTDKLRGNYPIGVSYHKRRHIFMSRCSVFDYESKRRKIKHLGEYETSEDAFNAYKYFKESYIKEVAEYYKKQIPNKLYEAMYSYEVEITD